MNVTQFAELLVEMLGINNHDKVDDRVVLAAADAFRGQLLDEMFSEMGSISGDYVKSFEATSINSDSIGQYIDLPCDLCPIPNNGAFRHIGPDLETGYIPLSPGSISTMNNMEVGLMAGRAGFLQIGRKIYFRYLPVPNPNTILLLLVPNLVWLYENAKDTELIGDAVVEAKLIKMCQAALMPKAQAPEDKDNVNKSS